MKPEVKILWVQALRSGKYEQGREFLRTNNKFCCLGVLCDLCPDGRWLEDQHFWQATGNPSDNSNVLLPLAVQKWAGLNTDDPEVLVQDDAKNNLAGLNDEGIDFNTIAQLIEEQL